MSKPKFWYTFLPAKDGDGIVCYVTRKIPPRHVDHAWFLRHSVLAGLGDDATQARQAVEDEIQRRAQKRRERAMNAGTALAFLTVLFWIAMALIGYGITLAKIWGWLE